MTRSKDEWRRKSKGQEKRVGKKIREIAEVFAGWAAIAFRKTQLRTDKQLQEAT